MGLVVKIAAGVVLGAVIIAAWITWRQDAANKAFTGMSRERPCCRDVHAWSYYRCGYLRLHGHQAKRRHTVATFLSLQTERDGSLRPFPFLRL